MALAARLLVGFPPPAPALVLSQWCFRFPCPASPSSASTPLQAPTRGHTCRGATRGSSGLKRQRLQPLGARSVVQTCAPGEAGSGGRMLLCLIKRQRGSSTKVRAVNPQCSVPWSTRGWRGRNASPPHPLPRHPTHAHTCGPVVGRHLSLISAPVSSVERILEIKNLRAGRDVEVVGPRS